MSSVRDDASSLLGFRRHLTVEADAGKGAFLFSEEGVTALHGPGIESLVPLLDGTHDIGFLLRSRSGGLEPEQIAEVIDKLIAMGLVVSRSPVAGGVDDRAQGYWDACGIAPTSVPGSNCRIECMCVGSQCDRGPVVAALNGMGLDVAGAASSEPSLTADLSVVICDDYLAPDLAAIDAAHRAAGVPWLLAKPVGKQVWIGPIFQPAVSACWHCLAERLWGHRSPEGCAQAALRRDGPASRKAVTVPAVTGLASSLIALEVTKWLAGLRYSGQGQVLTLDSGDLVCQHHEVRARPNCAHCGDPALVAKQARRPVVLRATAKASRVGGGHRSLPPEAVLERYQHLISPVTGVVKEITRDSSVPPFFNSYRSGPNLGTALHGMRQLRHSVRQHSGGKGATPTEAKVGALCEALERYCGSFRGEEERVRGSLTALGEPAIHPNRCMLYDSRQYAARADWNAGHGPAQHICEPFDDSAVMDWTPVWSLTEHRHRLLPTAMLYYGMCATDGTAVVRSVAADSNGNAAGSTVEDAVLQGLFELVERDAVALWWYNMTPAPGVDLAAFDDPWITDLCHQYDRIGREVWALDVTSDLEIPAMVAVSRRSGRGRDDIALGFGAHHDPHLALRRALTELNQLLPAALNTDLTAVGDPDAANWWSQATVAQHRYLLPDMNEHKRAPADYNHVPTDDIRCDVESIQRLLFSRGMDTLVLDQTRPDVGLPVVKVIVPGMRHFWARFAPGRLYDVPVELGRLTRPRAFDELNPYPLFY